MTHRTSVAFLAGISVASLLMTGCTWFGGGSSSSSSSSAMSAGASSVSANPNIHVSQPSPNATVTSPLTVTGEAKGTWYFEASFPVHLLDGNNTEIAVAPAHAQGDWMTENFVPFTVTLTFTTPSTPTGTLVLEKDNPSGLPQNADSISIPVQF